MTDELRLRGKVAVVTGGASGIGRALVRRLAAEGAVPVVVDRDAEPARTVSDEVGGRHMVGDVSLPADWARVVEDVTSHLGGIDVVCLNAGVATGRARIERLTDEQYRRILGVNVDGVVFGLRAVVPTLAAGGGGAIVVTASMAGLVPFAADPVYALTKHAVVGLVRSLAPWLARQAITLNAVCPEMVDTAMLSDQVKTALGRAGHSLLTPDEVAVVALRCVLGDATGECWVCQPGQPGFVHRFAEVPGPPLPGSTLVAHPG